MLVRLPWKGTQSLLLRVDSVRFHGGSWARRANVDYSIPAKTLVMTISSRDVSRDSSTCRFSNCSKRELIVPRVAPEGGAGTAVPLAFLLRLGMGFGCAALTSSARRAEAYSRIILEMRNYGGQCNVCRRFLRGTYRVSRNCASKNGKGARLRAPFPRCECQRSVEK